MYFAILFYAHARDLHLICINSYVWASSTQMNRGRPRGLSRENQILREQIVRLRDVEKLSFRRIGRQLKREFQNVHRIYHTAND